MPISDNNVAETLALCARHCCICRRFRPTHLQVHHIKEKSEGGSDTLDNLIAICVSCHSDVHTNTKLTRRFSEKELRLHRQSVYTLVREGRLPAAEGGDADLASVSAELIKALQSREPRGDAEDFPISIESLDILLSAAAAADPIRIDRRDSNCVISAGGNFYIQRRSAVVRVSVPDPLIKLLSLHLIDGSGDEYYVTGAGHAFSDDVLSANPSFITVKAKCMACGLHFVVCTWEPENHNARTLHCPECGQHRGAFMVWQQRMFGFIFQTVPGSGTEIAGTSMRLKPKKA